MPTFDLGMEVDDLQEAQLLPVDWYTLKIVADKEGNPPYREANKAMKEDPQDEKAGYNLVINLRVEEPDIPEFDNRPFRIWLPLPSANDEGKYTPMGQLMADSKAERIFDFAKAFSGKEADGSLVSLNVGMKAQLYITQEISAMGSMKGQLINSIDTFAGAKPVDEDKDNIPF